MYYYLQWSEGREKKVRDLQINGRFGEKNYFPKTFSLLSTVSFFPFLSEEKKAAATAAASINPQDIDAEERKGKKVGRTDIQTTDQTSKRTYTHVFREVDSKLFSIRRGEKQREKEEGRKEDEK